MAKNNVSELDVLAGNDQDLAGISILGTGLLSTADDSFRTLASFLAKWWDDIGAVNTVAGTATAVTITTPTLYGALKTGMVIAFKAGSTATGASTLNLDALGAKKIRRQGDTAIQAGDWLANATALLKYDSAYDSAAGAWVLLNPAGGNFYSDDAGAGLGPIVDLYRNSASPAAADLIAQLAFNGQNSTPAKVTYSSIAIRLDDVTAGSEDATVKIATMKAGALVDYLTPGSNAAGTATPNAVGLPLGQLSFPAAQNASSDANTLDDYREGTWTPGFTANGSSTSVAYGNQIGYFVKIGQWVYISGRLTLTNNGTGVGTAKITSLPFTSSSNEGTGQISFNAWANTSGVAGNLYGAVDQSATTITIRYGGATGNVDATDTTITNTADLYFTGMYRAAA